MSVAASKLSTETDQVQAADSGAPIEEHEADDENGDHDDDNDPVEEDAFGDEDDLGPPRRIHDEVTGPVRLEPAPAEDERPTHTATAQMAARPLTLPSEALISIAEAVQSVAPVAPAAAAVAAPVQSLLDKPMMPPGQAPTPTMALPGQALARPSPPLTTAMPPAPKPAATMAPARPMTLPGQALMAAGSASTGGPVRPPPVVRPSAASSIPFELRKKAERIYEQALKDQAEGRTASALMNAKLAMNFDSSVPAYKELFEGLNSSPKGGKPKGNQPRELVLHEQAGEAEGRGDYERAVKLLEEAITVNPKAAALYNRLGVVLSIRLKRHDEALAYLKKAIELEPGSIVYMNNFSKVTGLLESVLEKDPRAKRKGMAGDDKVAIKKMRPVKF
jgi:hypothetical protein